MSKKRVVVTGMGVVSPIGNNLDNFWNNLKNGINGINDISLFDTTNFDVKIAGESDIDLNSLSILPKSYMVSVVYPSHLLCLSFYPLTEQILAY